MRTAFQGRAVRPQVSYDFTLLGQNGWERFPRLKLRPVQRIVGLDSLRVCTVHGAIQFLRPTMSLKAFVIYASVPLGDVGSQT